MKQQLIKENIDLNTVKSFFDIDGTIQVTNDGLVVDGDIENKLNRSIKTLPFKFSKVSGRFTAENCKLENLENFPEYAYSILVIDNPINTFKGGDNIKCEYFNASNTKIQNLKHCPTAADYHFSECEYLTSTVGLPMTKFEFIELSNCKSLRDISNLTEFVGKSFSSTSHISWNPYLPLVKLVLLNKTPGYIPFLIDFENAPKKLTSIIGDFYGKGWSNALEFVRALTDAGFRDNAKL